MAGCVRVAPNDGGKGTLQEPQASRNTLHGGLTDAHFSQKCPHTMPAAQARTSAVRIACVHCNVGGLQDDTVTERGEGQGKLDNVQIGLIKKKNKGAK